MNVEVDVKLDKKTFNKINQFPNKFLYRVARQTLDMSYEYIPRLTGRLRNSSTAYGVKQHSRLDYSIGSQTSYASSVWVMNNSTTNWTTAGTGSQWYAIQFKKKGKSIVQNAINTSL